MNIAFLSSLDPNDTHSWSGTLYYIYKNLQKNHQVTWIGQQQYDEVVQFHQSNHSLNSAFIAEKCAPLFGKLLSDTLKYECYDLIICRDYFFLAYLVMEAPVIYIGDTTFRLYNRYMQIADPDIVQTAESLEEISIKKATCIIYSSE